MTPFTIVRVARLPVHRLRPVLPHTAEDPAGIAQSVGIHLEKLTVFLTTPLEIRR